MTTKSASDPLNTSTAQQLPSVDNPPGLDTLGYRMRTHASFKAEMIKALRKGPLRSLVSARDDDPSLALLDAWATTLDVLTFYQERIVNEGYLRTATERRSMQELGRAVGYELNPGVAAETYLAFTLEEGNGAPEKVIIDVGSRVQSVPGPGEQAQTFETVEKIEARPEWNALKPQSVEMVWPQKGDTFIYLKGINTGLKPGDGILIVGAERKGDKTKENWDFRYLKTVEPDSSNQRTRVTWDEELGHGSPHIDPAKRSPEVYAFRLRAALFGHNAPDWTAMPDDIKESYVNLDQENAQITDPQWPKFTIAGVNEQEDTESPYIVYLDAPYPQIRPDSWVVLARPAYVELYEIEEAIEAARTNFMLSSKTTRLKLKGENLLEMFNDKLRETVVFAQSEKLEITEAPLPDMFPSPVRSAEIESISKITLDRDVDGLRAGRHLLITGVNTESQEISSELVSLVDIEPENKAQSGVDESCTTLAFIPPLKNIYRRESITIYANVARATHGETRQEVLGSTDASQSFQQFTLRQSPLTFTPASTPGGGVNTLQVRVNEILWDETPTLYGSGPGDRFFTTRQGPDGNFIIQFGNGTTGARPPSGDENIHATHRVGLGTAGNVKAGQLRVLLSRPLGVRGVSNPQPATGGADPEQAADARLNAACAALTLDRIVTLRDYEDFARAFGGVGKARADWLRDGSRGVICITVMDAHGNALDDGSRQRLEAAMTKAHDPAQRFLLRTTDARRFYLRARLVIDQHYRVDAVLEKTRTALRQAFCLIRRDFGQDVTESEILSLIQSVAGVVAVDIEKPYPGDGWDTRHRLHASLGCMDPDFQPAELLLLSESLDAISLRAVNNLSEPELNGGQS